MGIVKNVSLRSAGATLMLAITAAGAYGATGLGTGKLSASAIRPEPPTSVRAPSTTSTSTTTTTVVPPVAPLAVTSDLAEGANSPEVQSVQQRLVDLGFDPGKVDGSFGLATRYAVEGFQKLQGLEVTGVVNAEVLAALSSAVTVTPLVADGAPNRVEIDLARQVLILYKDGKIRLISTISTGSGRRYCVNGACQTARTPAGDYRFLWRYSGWRKSRLGMLYNPVYFTEGGIAVHGSNSVPTYPASHGCIRIPMHIAGYFPSLVAKGDHVHVVGISPNTGGGSTEYITIAPPPPPPEPVPEEIAPVDSTTPTTPTTTPTTLVAPPADTQGTPPVSVPTSISTNPIVVTAPPVP